MPWIKRNLFFVVGVVVALGLMGYAGFFLFSQIKKDGEKQEELGNQLATFKGLHEKNPFPGQKNIDLVREDQKRIEAFVAQNKSLFAPIPQNTPKIASNDHEGFKRLLLNTVDTLQREANASSVEVPTNSFYFTFSAQWRKTIFAPGTIEPLSSQLAEISEICRILFNAKINALEGLRRTRVSKDDEGGLSTEFLTVNSVTNALAVITPYEVTFRSFTAELAAAMEGFLRAPQCFIVKTIHVETNSLSFEAPPLAFSPIFTQPLITAQPAPRPETTRPGGMDARMAERYGISPNRPGGGMDPKMAERYGLTTAPRAPTPPPAVVGTPAVYLPRQTSNVPVTILRENPLKITLLVELVKLKPAK